MSIVEWIIFGLIPGFLAGALAAHYRQSVRVRSGYSRQLPSPLTTRDLSCARSSVYEDDKLPTGEYGD